jgi:hypothetical protein
VYFAIYKEEAQLQSKAVQQKAIEQQQLGCVCVLCSIPLSPFFYLESDPLGSLELTWEVNLVLQGSSNCQQYTPLEVKLQIRASSSSLKLLVEAN